MDTDNNSSISDGEDDYILISDGEDETPAPPNSRDDDAYKCPICINYVRFRKPTVTLCGHLFCKSCINAAILRDPRCPLCKKDSRLCELQRIFL